MRRKRGKVGEKKRIDLKKVVKQLDEVVSSPKVLEKGEKFHRKISHLSAEELLKVITI